MPKKDTRLVPLMLRLPEGLRKQIEKRAGDHRHSLNSEVIHMLEEAIAKEDRLQLMQEIAERTAGNAVQEFIDKTSLHGFAKVIEAAVLANKKDSKS